jgi:hypothetical protein
VNHFIYLHISIVYNFGVKRERVYYYSMCMYVCVCVCVYVKKVWRCRWLGSPESVEDSCCGLAKIII